MGYQDSRSRFGDARERERYGERDYSRDRYNRDDDDRGFFDRAGDEVRSWFGDDDAQRRRQRDDREYGQDFGRDNDRYVRDSGSTMSRYGQDRYGEQRYGQGSYGQDRYSQGLYGQGSYGQGSFGQDRGGEPRYGRPASYEWGNAYGGQRQSQSRDHDPGYSDWRRRQMDQLDRDYDEYRSHNQSRFDSEFSTWRTSRQNQRDSLRNVDEHMEVVGSDGEKIGTVDKVRGDKIILAKNDAEAGSRHHSIPSNWIESVDSQVRVSKTAEEAKRAWRDEDRDEPYGGTGYGGDGPHNLNRAFSGTY